MHNNYTTAKFMQYDEFYKKYLTKFGGVYNFDENKNNQIGGNNYETRTERYSQQAC